MEYGTVEADPLILALTTEADAEQAEALARQLLERKLAACVALRPLTSLYWWQGRLERSQEVQLLIKSRASLLADLDAAVHRLHSYSTPEWLHWQAGSSEAYGLWLRESCLKPLNPDGSGPAGGDQPGGAGPAG
ncbi:MAG: divalent-cation tolerance protein CutA [Synechococcaceae bacterium WB4_1_0192]|nr:divalent-cation tolerance protein CutA [Synechococcaceae bacterium WB4_1_0192]